MTVTLAYTPNLMPTGKTAADVVIYTAPANTTDYTPLATTIVDDSHVSAQTSHFSIFVAAVGSASEEPDAGVPDAPSACMPVVQGGGQQCTIAATCNGHMYHATCFNTGCLCYVDNNGAQQVQTAAGTCTSTNGQPGWGACGFPN